MKLRGTNVGDAGVWSTKSFVRVGVDYLGSIGDMTVNGRLSYPFMSEDQNWLEVTGNLKVNVSNFVESFVTSNSLSEARITANNLNIVTPFVVNNAFASANTVSFVYFRKIANTGSAIGNRGRQDQTSKIIEATGALPADGSLQSDSGGGSFTARYIASGGEISGNTLFDDTTNINLALTLSTTGVNPAIYGNATHYPQITIDTKGRITLAANIPVTQSGIANSALYANQLSPGAYIASGGEISGNTLFIGNSNINLALTLATTAVSPGSYGNATNSTTFTVDSKGRLTAAGVVPIREKLSAPRTYYVRTDGSDSNDGLTNSAGGAFVSLGKAWRTICERLDQNGERVTIVMMSGTYVTAIDQAQTQAGLVPTGRVTFSGQHYGNTNVSTYFRFTDLPHPVGFLNMGFTQSSNAIAGGVVLTGPGEISIGSDDAGINVGNVQFVGAFESAVVAYEGRITINGNVRFEPSVSWAHVYKAVDRGCLLFQPLEHRANTALTLTSAFLRVGGQGQVYYYSDLDTGTFTGTKYIVGPTANLYFDTTVPGTVAGFYEIGHTHTVANTFASTANTLAPGRYIASGGEISGNTLFDGSQNINLALTLATTGVGAGTYGNSGFVPTIVVDNKGRITSATNTAIVFPTDVTNFTVRGNTGAALVSNNSNLSVYGGDGITGTTVTSNTGNVIVQLGVDSTVVRTTGIQSIGGAKTFTSDLTITGNVTITGETTYINTTTLLVNDSYVVLNHDLPAATAPTENSGIEVNRGSVNANVAIYWDETNDYWVQTTNTKLAAATTRIFHDGYANANSMTTGILPTSRVSGPYTGITGVGTITTGTWQGTNIAVGFGGTGRASFTQSGVLYGNGTGDIAITAAGTEGMVLQANSAGFPVFGHLDGGLF